ncbi:hypothetical protein D0B54_02045 [Solimonas sp. K1W22B-7]|nr:hypothetical protein D0B54_02045 [Solimonas sp. K1W22B-7]
MSSPAASPVVIVGLPYAQRRAWHASIRMQVDAQAGRSRLRDCEHAGPLRLQKVLYPQGEHIAQLLLLHPPGGIAGGDQLAIQLSVEENAHALLTTPGRASGTSPAATSRARMSSSRSLQARRSNGCRRKPSCSIRPSPSRP